MEIIDKASWQIYGRIQPSVVTAHFKRIFSWLEAKGLLSQEGKEILEFGIDESVSLHERLVVPEALVFLDAKYDDYLKHNPYGEDEDSSVLEAIFSEYQLTNKTLENNKIINQIDFVRDTKVYHEAR